MPSNLITLNMSPFPSLAGELSFYKIASGRKPFFKSGELSSKKALIFVGGLTDGIGSVAYAPKLSEAMEEAGWTLVQPQWSGAYDGFATGSLDRDVEEIVSLVNLLREDGYEKIVFMGHSTGSQDVIHYLLNKASSTPIDGGIMQAPVSDRQCFATSDEIRQMATLASEMHEQRKDDELMTSETAKLVGCRMSVYRAWSLLAEGGDDDYFSSDLPDHPDPSRPHIRAFSETFGKLPPIPALALYSAEDECATAVTDKKGLLTRWEKIAGSTLTTKLVPGANHAVEDPQAQVVLCKEVVSWLKAKIE